MKIIVTGGFGFIGNALIKELLKNSENFILNIDSQTNVSMPESIDHIIKNKFNQYEFASINIQDLLDVERVINKFNPEAIFHLAAETHVDNSIINSMNFIKTNIEGTFNLLEATRKYVLDKIHIKENFRFVHVSTDEVYGSLELNENPFKESNKYFPNSPYSASKASADHLVRAWYKTYGIPSIITNCSNNYGPWQYPEKLIPLIISRALVNMELPIYGDGQNVRDWIHVHDHVRALIRILIKGRVGESYNIGSKNEVSNIEIVKIICKHLDKIFPNKKHSNLISFVKDRPGHDFRYSVDPNKLYSTLDFLPQYDLESGLKDTVRWYVKNSDWLLKKSNSL